MGFYISTGNGHYLWVKFLARLLPAGEGCCPHMRVKFLARTLARWVEYPWISASVGKISKPTRACPRTTLLFHLRRLPPSDPTISPSQHANTPHCPPLSSPVAPTVESDDRSPPRTLTRPPPLSFLLTPPLLFLPPLHPPPPSLVAPAARSGSPPTPTTPPTPPIRW
jgi:hypothetical protein